MKPLHSFVLLLCLAATTPAAHAATETYDIDLKRAVVYWEVKHFSTSTTRGRFMAKGGSIELDKETQKGKVDVTIDMTSLSTGVAPFDSKLKSSEFFDTQVYPEGRFTGSRMLWENNELVELRGDLTLRDKTLPVTLKASHFVCLQREDVQREVCGGDFEATISRGQYGMGYLWPFISDKVRLLIQIEAVKQ
ncbi:MAG: YceI family protein [Burkholderiaceae bacterium]